MSLRPLIVATFVVAFGSVNARAALISIADALNQTGTYNITDPSISIGGEASLYLTARMTIDVVDNTNAFDVVELLNSGNSIMYQFGHKFNTDDFAVFFPSPEQIFDTGISAGESYLVVLKINQLTGAFDYFINPNLSLPEASATIFKSGIGPTATIETIGFRGGNASSGQVDFTEARFFTGDDTPFGSLAAAVPEPATATLGMIALGGLMLRRRRMA